MMQDSRPAVDRRDLSAHMTVAEENEYVSGFVAMWFRLHPQPSPEAITAWVAANFSDESKRLVAEGAEPTQADQDAFQIWSRRTVAA